jgi:hypothetical protein
MDTFNDRKQWNRASAELGTLLGVWTHPDDEAYLMAVARDRRNRVVVATATIIGDYVMPPMTRA